MMISKNAGISENLLCSLDPFYLISLLAVFTCTIPFFLLREDNSISVDSSTVILKLFSIDLNSKSLLYASICIMGSVTPMIIFLFCDLFFGTIRAAFIRFYRLATIFFPCSLIIFFAIPLNSIVLLAFAFTAQTILHLCGFIVRILSNGKKVWSFRTNMSILVMWTAALCLQMQQLLFLDNIYFEVGELVCSIIGFIIFSYYSYKWMVHVTSQYKKNRELSIDEFTCTKNVVILYLALIIRFVVAVSYELGSIPGSLVTLLVTQNAAALLVVVLHEYVLRSKLVQMEVT